MSTKLGISLIAIGLGLKGIRRGFKFIKKREYIDPQRMYPGGFYATMNRREAQLILGVSQGAESSLIKVRHRTLMLMNHPDNGGSTFIATKINQAKQLLISE